MLLNIVVWDNHASMLGTLCLLGCLAGGSLYQQAPLRAKPAQPAPPPVALEVKVEVSAPSELPSDTDSLLTERAHNSTPGEKQ